MSQRKPEKAFEFVTVASARAKQLLRGCTPKVQPQSLKKARVALKEVESGAVKREPASANRQP